MVAFIRARRDLFDGVKSQKPEVDHFRTLCMDPSSIYLSVEYFVLTCRWEFSTVYHLCLMYAITNNVSMHVHVGLLV